MCDRAAAQVIAAYSTSFALAAKALGQPERKHIRNIYAMVRIADELVDGTAAEAHECPETALDMYEEQVLHAPHHRFHTDPVLHAYARTHRECELDDAHVRAFFASMRADLTQTSYSAEELDTYIYGSAEAIGLMCLAVFLRGADPAPAERATMERGARALGSAFQKVNFLMQAAMGFINIEQNRIIKIFSVVSVVFLPPTLVASSYGMNFEFMPELHFKYGYPMAIGLMIGAALTPYIYFKRKGWL